MIVKDMNTLYGYISTCNNTDIKFITQYSVRDGFYLLFAERTTTTKRMSSKCVNQYLEVSKDLHDILVRKFPIDDDISKFTMKEILLYNRANKLSMI